MNRKTRKKRDKHAQSTEKCTRCNGRGFHEKEGAIAFGSRRNISCRACRGKGVKPRKD